MSRLKVAKGSQRYAIGAVLNRGDGLESVNHVLEQQLRALGYKTMWLEHSELCVRSSFPFVNMLSLFIAIKRVYPRLSAYIKVIKTRVTNTIKSGI